MLTTLADILMKLVTVTIEFLSINNNLWSKTVLFFGDASIEKRNKILETMPNTVLNS